ncbi:MAG: CCA tRNA nucleotidyltransferase [Candidatus Methanosuratus sp.]|nr:CCA tRNA nucleotidyltransferase [Candidatus Methanosuratincola sp.]
MSEDQRISAIKSEILQKVKPKEEDWEEIRRAVEVVKRRILEDAKERGLEVEVEVEGSVAKDTWISTDRDIDLFIIFPRGTERAIITGLGLELAKAGAGEAWKTGYAEHPYVEAEVLGCRMDIVPSGELTPGKKVMTAVDRTPLHTKYVREKLSEAGRDEVRVLKQFMKGVGVYGAELRVGGFSGYLCELLVIQYGSFDWVLKKAAAWRLGEVIDIEGHYSKGSALDAFDSPLVVIDPVDRGRNAAAAVTTCALATFVSASRHFLKRPSLDFFFPPVTSIETSELLRMAGGRGTEVIAIETTCPRLPSDVLWGEVNHSLSKIVRLLEEKGFRVLDSSAWSDEEKEVIFLLELEAGRLPDAEFHPGPSTLFPDDEDKFLRKHLKSERTVAGPFIAGERWNVIRRRESTDSKTLLEENLPKMKLSPDIALEVRRGFRLSSARELIDRSQGRPDLMFEIFMFLRKRPLWLKE